MANSRCEGIIVLVLMKTQISSSQAIDHYFYRFKGPINHVGCWENTRKACESVNSNAFETLMECYTNPMHGSCILYYLSLDNFQQKVRWAAAAQHLAQFESLVCCFQLINNILKGTTCRSTEGKDTCAIKFTLRVHDSNQCSNNIFPCSSFS